MLLESIENMFLRYYMHSGMPSMLKAFHPHTSVLTPRKSALCQRLYLITVSLILQEKITMINTYVFLLGVVQIVLAQ